MTQITEQVRQEYLSAMGISPWFRATELDSPELNWPELELISSGDVNALSSARQMDVGQNSAAQRSAELINQLVQPEADKKPLNAQYQPVLTGAEIKKEPVQLKVVQAKETNEESSQQLLEKPKVSTHSSVQFRLSLYVFGSVLIVEQLPGQAQVRLEQQTSRLVTRMLLAWLGQQETGERMYVQWPVFENPKLKQDAQAARQFFSSNLKQLSEDKGIERVVYLGEELSSLLLDGKIAFGQSGNEILPSLVTYSSSQLLSIPQLKKETWQQLCGFWHV